MDFDRRLGKYATVVVEVGLRVEPGDRLLIKAGLDDARLVRLVCEHAYRAGAVNVDVVWTDPDTRRARFTEGSTEAIDELPFDVEVLQRAGERGDSVLRIYSDDPELFADIDPSLVAKFDQRTLSALEDFFTRMDSLEFVWSAVAAPNPAWARHVFPDLAENEAVDRLWDAVFATCRVDEDDPVGAWNNHLADLAARSAHLTARCYDRLRYAGPGTDLTVGLPQGHIWVGGAGGKRGSVPNLPTEEVFTSPDRMRADGVIRATKPLSYFGKIIDNFQFRFEDGAVVSATAGTGQDALDLILDMDEGSVRLGEVALVPQSSLVAAQDLVWRHMLFDENDASHIALGDAYPVCFDGGAAMSRKEQLSVGLNHSDVHVDFVVGSPDLDIVGVSADGNEEPLLLHGEWAFDM
jgi:aminopeptidase